jgi:ubiquinone/menaquinone biosynthesis C-methylase UbiE
MRTGHLTLDDSSTIAERELAFWNARYRSLGYETPSDSPQSFREGITPAFERGGSSAGLVQRRAYDLVLQESIAGKALLDYCCGRGKWGVRFARLGARVSGFDMSDVGIEVARARALRDGVDIRLDVADARELPYENESFDIVVGISALEHVIKYPGTGDEARRVLRPGGLAVFTENLGENPLINFARRFTMRGEEDAGDILLTDELVRSWGHGFSSVTIEGYSLLLMTKRLLPQPRLLLRCLHGIDSAAFAIAPGLRRYCGECVIVLRA